MRKIGKIFWRTFWVLIAVCVGIVVAMYVSIKAPDPESMELPQPSTVYFSDGTTEIGHLTEPNRTVVPIDGISEIMQQAVIAAQDPHFEERPAGSIEDLVSGLWESLWGGEISDPDSITNRYADVAARESSIPVVGKLHDAFLPIKIDKQLSKDQILANYLNTAYFGRGAYGVEAAAQTYFGVPAAELSLSQAALLTALMPAPSSWDPAIDAEQASVQYAKVLAALVSHGAISQEEADGAAFPQVQPMKAGESFTGTNGYLLAAVREELVSQARIAHEAIDQGGLKVISLFDADKQQAAVDAVAALPQDRPHGHQVALISLDPKNGAVLAMYGGADYAARQTNAATQDRIPAGSTFKTFAMVEALEQGIPLSQTYYGWNGVRTGESESGGYLYLNPGDKSYGLVNMQQLTKFAVNSASVHLNGDVTPAATKERAVSLGIPADAPELDDSAGNVMGQARVTAQEMARAYAALDADGWLPTIHTVLEVHSAQGNTIYTSQHEGQEILKKETAQLATYALASTFDGPEEAPLDLPGMAHVNGAEFDAKYPSAGQATNETDTLSASFVGYTAQLVTAVSMFQLAEDGSLQEMQAFGGEESMTGSGLPLKLWSSYMTAASEGMQSQDFADVSALLGE